MYPNPPNQLVARLLMRTARYWKGIHFCQSWQSNSVFHYINRIKIDSSQETDLLESKSNDLIKRRRLLNMDKITVSNKKRMLSCWKTSYNRFHSKQVNLADKSTNNMGKRQLKTTISSQSLKSNPAKSSPANSKKIMACSSMTFIKKLTILWIVANKPRKYTLVIIIIMEM